MDIKKVFVQKNSIEKIHFAQLNLTSGNPPVKPLLHSVFSNDHLKHKTINKTTCTMSSALVEELSNCYDYFLRLSGFPDLFGKVFLITFKFS